MSHDGKLQPVRVTPPRSPLTPADIKWVPKLGARLETTKPSGLVLARQKEQSIIIHHDGSIIAVISVAEIRGDKVRLAISADKALMVDREEVYLLKSRGNEQSPAGLLCPPLSQPQESGTDTAPLA